MKTRLLKRLRRMAKTRVFAQWDGFCFTIVWKKWRSVDEGVHYVGVRTRTQRVGQRRFPFDGRNVI